jgi:hypothetical protein
MFDIVLALDSVTDVVKPFEIDQSLQSIPFSEAFDEARPMLKHPADKIARYPNIQNAVRAIGQNVHVATCHAEILQDVDGRDKPGHDEFIDIA